MSLMFYGQPLCGRLFLFCSQYNISGSRAQEVLQSIFPLLEAKVTFHEDGKTTIGSPKSEAGKREIPLNDSIKSILSSQRKKQSKIVPMSNRIFTSLSGEIVSNPSVNRAIRNALKRLEQKGKPIEHFTAHALRDTFATRYIEQGGNPQTLKTILGHKRKPDKER